jgi:Xaa-Pro aminopeptidase
MPWRTPPGAGATVHIWNGYSPAERDRRWNAVRENARRAGFDCVLVPLGDGIDARYMTQLRCSAMVLPSDGRAPIVIADRRSSNAWIPDPWQTGREWAEPMGEALLDLGMERARVGVSGLSGGTVIHCHSIDGVVNHTALAQVMAKVPNASFDDATDVIGLVRYVKSEEEISFIRESTQVASAGLDELIRLARPGVDAGVLYADVLAHILELRSEYTPPILTIGSIHDHTAEGCCNPPIGRRLQQGDLIINEISAIRGAQTTQVSQPILLGSVPETWQDIIALQREVYEAGWSMIKPGTTFGALCDLVNGLGGEHGIETALQLAGCGYGDDGPLYSAETRSDRTRDLAMAAGNVFTFQPIAMARDRKTQFSWGGPVLVTDIGCEPLFKREHGMVEIN